MDISYVILTPNFLTELNSTEKHLGKRNYNPWTVNLPNEHQGVIPGSLVAIKTQW